MMKKWLIFSVLVLRCFVNLSMGAIVREAPVDMKNSFTGNLKINEVLDFTITITPFEDILPNEKFVIYCGTGRGIEDIDRFKGAEEGFPVYSQPLEKGFEEGSGPFWWCGRIKKNEPIYIKGKIKPIQPGIWNFWTAIHHEKAVRDKYSLWFPPIEMYIVVDNDGNLTIYENYEGIPQDYKENRIVSYLELKLKETKIPLNIIPHRVEIMGMNSNYNPYLHKRGPSPYHYLAVDRFKLKWQVIGDIGEIDEDGNFTGTKLGKGKIVSIYKEYVKGEIEVEVIPDKEIPPDKIVDVIIVPYDTEEEREWVDKVLKEYKGKRFKSKREAHMKFNPKGAFKAKEVIKDKYFGEIKREYDQIIIKVGEGKILIAKGITADGKIVEIPRKGWYWYFPDCFVGQPCNCDLEPIDTEKKLKAKIVVGAKEGICRMVVAKDTPDGMGPSTTIEVKVVTTQI